MSPQPPISTRNWLLVGLLTLLFFFIGYILVFEFSAIQDRFTSAGAAWTSFVIIAGFLLIWALLSLITFDRELESLKNLKLFLERKLAGRTKTDLRGLPDDLIYTREGSDTIELYPRIFDLDARYALERLNPFSQVGVQHIPALLTALGIFFTFIGLIIGIGELDLQGSSDRLMEGMTTLLGGVGLAFRSSLAGICLSFLMLIITRVQISRADSLSHEISQLATKLENERQQDPTILLRMMRGDTQDSANTLHEMRQHSDEISNKVGTLGTDLAEALSGQLTAAIDQTIGEPLEEMNRQMLAFQQEGLNTHQKTLGNILDTFLEDFSSTMGTQFSELDSALEKTLAWHRKTENALNQLVEKLGETQQEQASLLEETREFEEERFLKNTEFFEETRKFHDSRQANEKLLHSERIAGEEELHQKHLEERKTLLADRVQKEQELYRTRMKEQQDFFADRFEDEQQLLQERQDLHRSLMEDQQGIFSERIETEKALLRENQEMQQSHLSSLRDFFADRISDEKELHESTMEDKRLLWAKHRELTEALTETSNEVSQSIGEFRQAHEELTSLLDTTLGFAKTLDERLDKAANEQIMRLSSLQESMARMETFTSELPREYRDLLTQMQDELQSGLSTTFEAFDGSTAQVIQHLSGTYARIEGSLNKLNEELTRLSTEVPTKLQQNGASTTKNLNRISAD